MFLGGWRTEKDSTVKVHDEINKINATGIFRIDNLVEDVPGPSSAPKEPRLRLNIGDQCLFWPYREPSPP